MTTPTYHGQCHCGTVQWSVPKSAVTFTSICHCLDCQASTGSSLGSSSLMIYDAKAVSFKSGQDAIRVRRGQSERGKTTQRGFCTECGTPLFNHVSEGQSEEHWAVRTGTMGVEAGELKIDKEIFMKRKLPWVPTVTASSGQQFDAMPD